MAASKIIRKFGEVPPISFFLLSADIMDERSDGVFVCVVGMGLSLDRSWLLIAGGEFLFVSLNFDFHL